MIGVDENFDTKTKNIMMLMLTEEYLAFFERHGAPSDEKYLWDSCGRSCRILRDGSFEGRCPRHFVPGYDRGVPPGQMPFAHPGGTSQSPAASFLPNRRRPRPRPFTRWQNSRRLAFGAGSEARRLACLSVRYWTGVHKRRHQELAGTI
jgi:hypothetical protein